jgi:threonine/homoserine/homoserine lactone efflux protein
MATGDNRAVTIDLLLGFLGVSALVIATPGPDTALTIRNALTGGRRAGTFTAFGVATGQATWALFSAAGVAAILSASQPAFTAIRVAGAGYLIWLGLQSLLAAATRSRHHAWLAAYAVAVARARAFLRRRSLARLIDGLSGVVLVGLGIRLAHD